MSASPEGPAGRVQGESGGHGGASGRWLVSYADFITLLMVVFMILYSMARVDGAKFGKLKASLANSSIGGPVAPLPVGGNTVNTAPAVTGPDPRSFPGTPAPLDPASAVSNPPPMVPRLPEVKPSELPKLPSSAGAEAPADASQKPVTKEAAGPLPASPGIPAAAPKPEPAPAPEPVDALGGLRDAIQTTSSSKAGNLKVQIQDRGLVVSVLTSVLFQEGAATLKDGASRVLDEIVAQLKTTTYPILVEGSPDGSAKEAPWDLASRRAGAVVQYLVSTHGVAADRFAVIGYGKGAGVDGIVNVVVLRRNP